MKTEHCACGVYQPGNRRELSKDISRSRVVKAIGKVQVNCHHGDVQTVLESRRPILHCLVLFMLLTTAAMFCF